jgi:sugar lactone lactonase YvrE
MELYASVSDTVGEQVNVYPVGATGDGQPTRSIHGPSAQFQSLGSLALDNSRNLYVADFTGASITVFPPDASGDASPIRVIKGDQTHLGLVQSLALDSAGYLYALNLNTRIVTVYAPGASGNAAPVAILRNLPPGEFNDNLNDIAIDSRDYLYVATSGPPAGISVYAPGAVEQANPVRRITGAFVTVSNLDFDSDDNLYVADSINVAVFQAGADGNVPPIRTFAESGNNSQWLAVDTDGLAYVGSVDDEDTNPQISVFAAGASSGASPIRVINGGFHPISMSIDKPRTPRLQFVHWTSASENVALGTLYGGNVTLSGPLGTAFFFHDDYPNFGTAAFTPQLAATGMVEIVGGLGHSFTLSFDAALHDPIFHLGSLASVLTFPAGTALTRLSGDDHFVVAGNVVTGNKADPVARFDGTLGPSDSNGSVRLAGAFSTIKFTLVPNFADGTIPDGVFLQVGGARSDNG